MSTNILALPLYTFGMTVRTNEDWLDAWAYLDPTTSNAISLAGLAVSLMVRSAVGSIGVPLIAATSATVAGLPVAATIVLQANILGLSVLQSVMSRVPPGSYVFEVLAQADGVSRVIAAGPLTVLQGVVR